MGYKHSALKAACLAGVCGLIVLTACSNGRPDSGKKTDSVATAVKAVPKDTVIAPPAVVALLAMVLLTKGLKRFTGGDFLSRADLLVIYVMLLIGVMVSTRGAVTPSVPTG